MGGNRRGGGNRRRSSGKNRAPEAWEAYNPLRNNPVRGVDLRKREGRRERPKWVPPALSSVPVPTPQCPYCGKPIRDLAFALTDRASGEAVHFDCMAARVGERERPDKGESVVYLGGGRFGIVRFGVLVEKRGGGQKRGFSIKRIIEMEDRGERPAWRGEVADHFSVT